MALSDAVAAIRDRAESLWPSIESAVPISWPNETFVKPAGDNASVEPFLAIRIRWNGGGFMSIGAPGSNRARRQGHIWIYAFVSRGSGESRAHELVAKAGTMFEGADFSGVVCQAMEPGGDAESEDGKYYGQSAAIPFDFDETA